MFLTVVGCLEIKMQHLQTNVGRLQTIFGNVEGLVLTLHRHYGEAGGRLRSGCWHLRSWLAWKAERCYLCSVDVGRADPEKPNSKESKERKELRFYE